MDSIKTTQKQRNVLLVDSDKDLIRNIQDYLEHHEIKEKHGLNFVFAGTCKEALKKIAEQKIDLIILEIVLPVVNGYYLLSAIKKEKTELPVVIYTRLKGPQDLAKMVSLKADNIFLKQLMKMEDMVQMIIGHEENKVELDKVLLELQSQVKSLSESETQSNLKVTRCPRCNMILSPESHFCNNCGQKIFRAVKKIPIKKPSKKVEQKS